MPLFLKQLPRPLGFLNPQPSTLVLNPKPQTLNQKSGIQTAEPQNSSLYTLNPKPLTLNP